MRGCVHPTSNSLGRHCSRITCRRTGMGEGGVGIHGRAWCLPQPLPPLLRLSLQLLLRPLTCGFRLGASRAWSRWSSSGPTLGPTLGPVSGLALGSASGFTLASVGAAWPQENISVWRHCSPPGATYKEEAHCPSVSRRTLRQSRASSACRTCTAWFYRGAERHGQQVLASCGGGPMGRVCFPEGLACGPAQGL